MEIHYAYRIEDFEEITDAAYKAHPRSGRTRRAFLLIGIAVVLLPFLAGGSLIHPDWSVWPLLPFAVCLIYAGFQTPKRIARRTYGRCIFPYEYKANISRDGIVTMSPTVHTHLKWEAFSHAIESTGVVALVYEAVMYVFPRRAFTEAEWQEFMGLIRERVPRKS